MNASTRRIIRSRAVVFLMGLSVFPAAFAAEKSEVKTHLLGASSQTVAWGYYDASRPPVLRIRSGDLVDVETMFATSLERLRAVGLADERIQSNFREITEKVSDKGPGPHMLTGPILVEGADPGDVLQVDLLSIQPAVDYAYNGFSPGRGFLPEDFPYARGRLIALDLKRNIAKFSREIEIPLRPFFGSIGVAPPASSGRISSAPPWTHAGNMDNKELVAGSTLYIPIHVPGALLSIGDGHAGQGDGEVDISAMETSLKGRIRLTVRSVDPESSGKDLKLQWPRAETRTHYITMGFHEDLTEATRLATREMIAFLVQQKNLDRDSAYMLSSIAADLRITQLVDGNKGVHCMIEKSLFARR